MCKVLGIRRSTYYKKCNWTASHREIETKKLDAEIKKIYFDSKKRYGAPKIHNIISSDGRTLSLKRVQRRMAAMGLRSIVIKKYRHYSDHTKVVEQENLLKQELREPTVYNSIITAIAGGASRSNEISTKMNMESAVCAKYLKVLLDLGIIKKETPITEKGGTF